MMLATNFGQHHQKRHWDTCGPFPRSVWIHPNTPKDNLDRICFKIWAMIQSPGQDLGSGSLENTNKPSDIIVNSETAPLNDECCDWDHRILGNPSTEDTNISIPGRLKVQRHAEQNRIKQMVQQEFNSLSKGHNIQPGGPEVRKDLYCHGEDRHDSKQDGTSTEDRQQRTGGKLQDQKGKTVPWLPVTEEYLPHPCPTHPWNGRTCQRSSAARPSPPASSNTGGARSVKEIQDFLKKILLKPGREQIPPNQQSFLQDKPISKGTVQTEMPQLLPMFNDKSDIPETDRRRCQTLAGGTNHDLNADGLRVDQSFGTAEDGAKRPAGPRSEVKRHPCLETTTRPETMTTGTHPKCNIRGFESIPPHGAPELGSHLRSAGNTALPVAQAIGVPPAAQCQTHPVRPPPGFQPLQHLFPQLFPAQQLALQPRLNPLQIPTVRPVNPMNVVQEGIPPPIILFLPPGQPAPPFLLPANIMDPPRLPGGGSLWPSTPLRRDNFQDNTSPNSIVHGFSETPLLYLRSQRWMQPS